MIVGTPGYMPPEQWRGADPDERSDLYSVGRVGIQMLTGLRRPSEDADVDLTDHHTGDRPATRSWTCWTGRSPATRSAGRSLRPRCVSSCGPWP